MGVEKDAQAEKVYIIRYCPTCNAKLNLAAFICFNCGKRYNFDANSGKWVDLVCRSTNPADAIYNRKLNDVEKCFSCFYTQQGRSCKYIYCFGSGRGNCNACQHFESIRHDCCQEIVSADKALEADDAAKVAFQELQIKKVRESIMPFEKKEGVSL